MLFGFQCKMGNSQSISLLTYDLDDTVLPSDHVNANFRNYMDNFTDIDDGLYVKDEEYVEFWRNLETCDKSLLYTAQVLVGIILLYTCREFERQMGSRKFSAFLLLALGFSIFSLLALVVSTY